MWRRSKSLKKEDVEQQWHKERERERGGEKVREKEKSKGVLKSWALKTEKRRETQKSLE